jgi:hypothetical protein
MNTEVFLQRARSAREMPTLYWLGKGGWTHTEAAPAQPGRPLDVTREFEAMRLQRPKVHAAYVAGLAQSGLTLAELPQQACDCSGFVCWALGVPRDGAAVPGGWIGTDAVYADAMGPQRLFKSVEKAAPGVLVVFPKPQGQGPEGPPGHIGIVTEVAADGRVARVLHCAPDNFLLAPQDGLPRNAIAETGPAHFDADARTRFVAWRGFETAA